MVTRKFRGMWHRERSRRFAIVAAALGILASGLPAFLNIGPADLADVLPLVICAVFMTLVGPRHSRWLAEMVIFVACVPIFFTRGEEQMDAVRNALFVSVGAIALAWAHRRQRERVQERARTRRLLVGRVKNRAKRLQKTGSELRLAVERSEVAQKALLEHLPVHVLQKDLDGRFTFVSQSFSRLLNHDVRDILGRTDYDFYERPIADKFRQDDERVASLGRIVDDVERTTLPDGSVAYMQVRKAPLRDSKGHIVGVQGIFWDVTEALSGRKQLQRIESWAHALIQAALDAVLIVDIEGRVLEANPAVETILGYRHHRDSQHPPLGDIMRTSANDVVAGEAGTLKHPPLHNETSKGTELDLLNRLLKKATGRRIEVRLRRCDDTWFDAEISAHPLVVENSSGWAIFIRDITRRKQSVSELKAAKEAAERANLAKSEFVANVSHELRTPLTGIVGLHELLERTELDEQQREYLALARTSSDNLLSLIDALLDFSKIEAQRLELEREAFDLIECVESAAVSLAARAQLRGLELVIDCAPDLPHMVYGDEQRVRQVLLNLIGNAIKFTRRGDIRLRVLLPDQPAASADVKPGSVAAAARAHSVSAAAAPTHVDVRFEVIDAGIGIAEETQALIFEAFRQADSSTTRRYGGTGLGLAICRELVNLMGGTLAVRSTPQQGSTFYFTLPLELASNEGNAPVAESVLDAQSLSNTNVALVAQPTEWRNVLARDLRAAGCNVTCISVEQLLAREPTALFVAGNHTVILADFRELLSHQPASLPVVERVVLAVPIAFARPTQTPSWLRHADYHWLPRPVRRAELRRALVNHPAEDLATARADRDGQTHVRQADILLVEDSPINQTVLQGILIQLGHKVSLARNGEEAVNKCAAKHYDVVLMDIQMPEVDGLEATRRIRKHESESGERPVHIIALTAHAMPSDREQSRAAGMNGFLVKPIPLEALRRAIAAVPHLKGEPQAAADSGAAADEPATAEDQSNLLPAEPLEESTVENSALENFLPSSRPDWSMLEELLGGNARLAREVLDLLRFEAPRLFAVLRDSCATGNAREARRAAHTLKSNLRNVGLEEVAALAGSIESLALKSEWTPMPDKLAALDTQIDSVVRWCDKMLAMR